MKTKQSLATDHPPGDLATERESAVKPAPDLSTDDLLVRAQLTAIAAVERLLAGEGGDEI